MLGALVEGHDDVGTQADLGGDGALGTEKVGGAIEVRAEGHPLFADLAQIAQAEDLKAARVGEDRAIPGHELLHAAELADHVNAWAKIEMIGVVEQALT